MTWPQSRGKQTRVSMMMMMMKILTIKKYCRNVSMQLGHHTAGSVYHAWMLGHGEPGALFGGTVALSNSKQKGSWSRHTLPFASLALPRQEILLLVVKWPIIIWNNQPRTEVWRLHLRAAPTSTGSGSSAHKWFTSVQFITNSSWTASKSNAWLSTGACVDL